MLTNLSIVLCFHFANTNQSLLLALTFSCLVLSKHLFAPLGIPFAVYLLRRYCWLESDSISMVVRRLAILVGIAFGMLTAAFLPFLLQASAPWEQMTMILQRLFPFSRGLVHAYWAPNFWALYSFIDRLAVFVLRYFGPAIEITGRYPQTRTLTSVIKSAKSSSSSLTSGIIGDTSMSVLPDISPALALTIVVLMMLPAVVAIFKQPQPAVLIRAVINCSFSLFIFGYHVHEKAILVSLVPLALIAHESPTAACLFLQTSIVGIYSFFPLFTGVSELPIKCIIFVVYISFIKSVLSREDIIEKRSVYFRLILPITLYALSFLFVFSEILFPSLNRIQTVLEALTQYPGTSKKLISFVIVFKRFEFLPLLFTSVSCAISLVACWILSFELLRDVRDNKRIEENLFEIFQQQSLSDSLSRCDSNDDFSFLANGIENEYETKDMSFQEFETSASSSSHKGMKLGGILKGVSSSCSDRTAMYAPLDAAPVTGEGKCNSNRSSATASGAQPEGKGNRSGNRVRFSQQPSSSVW